MNVLSFGPVSALHGTRRVRRACFKAQPALAVPSACLIANTLRDVLSKTLDASIEVRLFEPTVPSAQAWDLIANDALTFLVNGTQNNAAIVIRETDARALASAAFGEYTACTGALSPLERQMLERMTSAIGGALAPACGSIAQIRQEAIELHGFAAYVEIQIEKPFVARIGIAVQREPAPHVSGTLPFEALHDVELSLSAQTYGVTTPARAVAELRVGDIVPITNQTGVMAAVLTLAGRPLARGECGVRGNRLALAIRLSSNPEGSCEPES